MVESTIVETALDNGLFLREKRKGGVIKGYCIKLAALPGEARGVNITSSYRWWTPTPDGQVWLCFSDEVEALRHLPASSLERV